MKNIQFNRFFALLFLLATQFCLAKITLPALISDGMVLQRNQNLNIWGMADPGEEIEISFLKKHYKTIADQQGKWKVVLPKMKAGGPYSMNVNEITINNILIGDVWLFSGQSNMEFPVRRVMDKYSDEVNKDSNAFIHHLRVPINSNYHAPQSQILPAQWKSLTPENAEDFSAVGYFFAKDQYAKNKIPVGIITSAVGGSPIESWISEEGLKEFPHYLHERDLYLDDALVKKINQLDSERRNFWLQTLHKNDLGISSSKKWFSEDYNDQQWQTVDLNHKEWSKDSKKMVMNGSFWFRKKISLTENQVKNDAVLRLGCIVDADSVFVNGAFVGTTSYQYPPRIYKVPKSLLKEGINTVTVRLISYSGMPQFVNDKPYKLITSAAEIDLSTNWKYALGVRMPAYQAVPSASQKPTGFYNAMIAPLQNYSFCGYAWYQGETNTGRAGEYSHLLTSLINDWRKLWNTENAPFEIVQLTSFMQTQKYPSESGWAELRNQQFLVSKTVPNTGLAVTIDIGEWNDIHPLNKKDVGIRLSLQAQKALYDKNLVADGPIYESMKVEGNTIVLSFKEGSNDFSEESILKGFAIKEKEGNFKWAKAKIDGRKIIVWNDEIQKPTAVRYAWADNPDEANLKNKQGLPASPFTTE